MVNNIIKKNFLMFCTNKQYNKYEFKYGELVTQSYNRI
jgi:hypothetical protein